MCLLYMNNGISQSWSYSVKNWNNTAILLIWYILKRDLSISYVWYKTVLFIIYIIFNAFTFYLSSRTS